MPRRTPPGNNRRSTKKTPRTKRARRGGRMKTAAMDTPQVYSIPAKLARLMKREHQTRGLSARTVTAAALLHFLAADADERAQMLSRLAEFLAAR